MHMHWNNCPNSMKGQYHNPKKEPIGTISCEVLCDHNLYCWHWFSRRCGTNNDITVMDNSPLILSILRGDWNIMLPNGYDINSTRRMWLSNILVDGIYIHPGLYSSVRIILSWQNGRCIWPNAWKQFVKMCNFCSVVSKGFFIYLELNFMSRVTKA